MKIFDRLCAYWAIMQAFKMYAHDHPDIAVPKEAWGSIAIRAAGMIADAHFRYCGLTIERIIEAYRQQRFKRDDDDHFQGAA